MKFSVGNIIGEKGGCGSVYECKSELGIPDILK